MRKIYKLSFDPVDVGSNEDASYFLPLGCKIIKIGEDRNGSLCAWYSFDYRTEQQPPSNFIFKIVGTGQEFDETGYKYLGSAIMKNYLVWHVMMAK